jgi:hypothetical protein
MHAIAPAWDQVPLASARLFDPDRDFEYERVAAQELHLDAWHKRRAPLDRVLVLEIGAGTQVPTVRNKVFGRGTHKGFLATNGVLHPQGGVVRINVEHGEWGHDDEKALAAAGRAITLPLGALDALQRIDQALTAHRPPPGCR